SVASKYTDIVTSVFSTTIAFKVWFATAAILLAVVQVLTGARIFGKLERFVPLERPRVNRVHRWSGRLAVFFTVPVAFHCIFILGFKTTSPRVVAHCILGSFVYGVFVVKVFFVHDRLHPRWVVPVLGGTMASVLAGLWATSALWYFTNVHFGF
ncbi:MAG: DUF6529 family protein, partial [Gaiellaceae bacterium]